jgi:hypothetical protein
MDCCLRREAVNTSRIVEFLTQRPFARRRRGVYVKPIYRRCCGIDVHKKSVSVCVLPPEGQHGEVKRDKFGTFLRDLKRLREWLRRFNAPIP